MADEWDQYLAPESDEWDQYAVAVKPSGATRSFAPEDLAKQAMDEERRSKSATLSNVLPDIARIGKDAWGMVSSPVKTLRGAYDILSGAVQTGVRDVAGMMGVKDAETLPNTPAETAFMTAMEPVTQSIMEPETIVPRLKKYTEERPVMSLLNASLLTSGAGKVAEAAGAAETGAMIGKVGSALNPVVMAGKGTAATVKTVVPPITKIIKESLGAYTGRGPGFVEEMVKGAESAEKAMRGEITGQEVVSHAREGLQKLRDMRGEEYVAKLEKVRANPEELQGVASDLNKTVERLSAPDRFDLALEVDKSGKLSVDFSRSTIVEHQAVVKRALEDISGWTDNSAAGLDTLKKRLSTYADQAGNDTPAKALITQLEKNLSGGLKKTVPEYEEMTRGYREASTLIKDIESNLMLRKEGMTGRITADQTLRRLSSAFRESFEMRKDLLRALGTESGMDIPAEVAGYLAQQWLPAGMIGKGLATANAYLGVINPKMWPILAASSPRVVGEFLNAFGKAKNWVESKAGSIKSKYGPTGPAEGPPPDYPTRGMGFAPMRAPKMIGQRDWQNTGSGYVADPYANRPPTMDAVYEETGVPALPPSQRMLPPPGEPPVMGPPDIPPPRPGTEPPAAPIIQPGATSGGKQPWEMTRKEYEEGSLYHGTNKRFDKFQDKKRGTGTRSGAATKEGVWLTEDEGHAGYWATEAKQSGGRKNILRVRPDVKKTLTVDMDTIKYNPETDIANVEGIKVNISYPIEDIVTGAKKKGYDSVRFENIIDDDSGQKFNNLIVFNSNQLSILNHKKVIKQALSEGKPVPPEVLADYPDLKAPEVGAKVPWSPRKEGESFMEMNVRQHAERKAADGGGKDMTPTQGMTFREAQDLFKKHK